MMSCIFIYAYIYINKAYYFWNLGINSRFQYNHLGIVTYMWIKQACHAEIQHPTIFSAYYQNSTTKTKAKEIKIMKHHKIIWSV